MLGADFGHHGDDCTFETVMNRFGVKDRRVQLIAEIVHEAFTPGRAAGVRELGVNAVWTGIDPGAQRVAAASRERALEQLPVLSVTTSHSMSRKTESTRWNSRSVTMASGSGGCNR
jgi:hypothetical protein